MADHYQYFSFSHRCLDPAILYFDPLLDSQLPDLKTCKERAGVPNPVSHEALADAMDVVHLLRKHFSR
jgi:hypothetical protein